LKPSIPPQALASALLKVDDTKVRVVGFPQPPDEPTGILKAMEDAIMVEITDIANANKGQRRLFGGEWTSIVQASAKLNLPNARSPRPGHPNK
jgi:hypothetical protein